MSAADRFRAMHDHGLFVMPNAWDVGSARLLEHRGFPAVATTSSGHAGSLGRLDQHVGREELLTHAKSLVAAVSVPVSVDSEGCFPDEPGGVAGTVDLIAETGAAGCSIEDYHPTTGLLPVDVAVERVEEAAAAAARHDLVLTARAENHLYGVDDLDDTISRLNAYRRVGADVVYAPGLKSIDEIAMVVQEVDAPVNVLLLPGGPSAADLSEVGVRRISTGGALAFAAYGALAAGARELLEHGTSGFTKGVLTSAEREAAFGER
jgi:2-methylisocitrate lyase-like PEP mutase family enzyme